ncbi:MAG: hypothetical protein HY286_01425 [Planctomycetes bacterium]|nr:hypothetical protein [Planctomycetota bacterium]
MNFQSRRGFLVEVGRGMITASLGLAVADEFGFAPMFDWDDPKRLEFGTLDPLVTCLAETPAEKLNVVLVEKLRAGTSLRDLTAAAALLNARTFGGQDYVGFHTMMALAPAYRMSLESQAQRQALPVLKVLYRNTNHIQERNKSRADVLQTTTPGESGTNLKNGESLRDAVRGNDLEKAERIFATIAGGSASDTFNALLPTVQDGIDVHRVVMPHRVWDLLDVIGSEHAHTLLRQSIHYCLQNEPRASERNRQVRTLLPKLLDQYSLLAKTPGTRMPDDAEVERLSRFIFAGTPEDAGKLAAIALSEGMSPVAVGEAIALAANQLLLRDHGRTQKEVQAGKPLGSVHGDSIGLHACDSANAWRGMARAGNPRNTFASLILGACQVAVDRTERGGDFLKWEPWPNAEHLAKLTVKEPDLLLREADAAIRANDQARACAAIYRYGELGYPEQAAFDLLLRFAVSEDGALHAEKYYRTAREEFAAARPAFRWRHACSLARVTASEFGLAAPGHAQACELLKV